MSAPAIQFEGDRLSIRFDRFDHAAYDLFLRVKRLPEYEMMIGDDGLSCGITAPARLAPMLGVEMPTRQLAQLLWPSHFSADFDDQPAIVQMALDAKRFACWSDCGLGKTPIGLEWSRQVAHRTGRRVLIVTLNEIAPQWIEEANKFYGDNLPIVRLNSREEMKRWCAAGSSQEEHLGASKVGVGAEPVVQSVSISHGHGVAEVLDLDNLNDILKPVGPDLGDASALGDDVSQANGPVADVGVHPGNLDTQIAVVNYDKFNHDNEADQVVSELKLLGGIVLDESSRLKTGGGTQKWALIKSARGIEYKLSLTATPAPNELMEFASQASFLERMRSESIADAAQQIIWTYFTRDPKTHRWTIKQHARAAFFEWMASWSIYVRDPRKYGWRKNWSPPPEPEYFRHDIAMTDEQRQLVMDFNADPRNVAAANVGSMFAGDMNAIVATKLSQAAKGFIYQKGEPCESVPKTSKPALTISVGEAAPASEAAVTCSTPASVAGNPTVTTTTSNAPANLTSRNTSKITKMNSRGVRPVDSLKPAFVADLIADEMIAGHQVLVWTVFDEEVMVLAKLLAGNKKLARHKYRLPDGEMINFAPTRDIDVITGKSSEEDRLCTLSDFRGGFCRCLITRASMLGYGMNLQFVSSMIFSGWSFSYEQFYQAIRRAYRHGQQQRLRVHLPVIPELEGQMYDAIVRKQRQHEEAIAEMEQNYVRARAALIGTERAA